MYPHTTISERSQGSMRKEEREMSTRPLDSLAPTETLEIENGLSLAPRVKFLLTIFRSDSSVKPVDEWKLTRSLVDFFGTHFVSIPDGDLTIRRFKDLRKRKRNDPVAHGALVVRDLGFLSSHSAKGLNGGAPDVRVLEKRLLDWRVLVVDKMNGMGMNIEGARYRLGVVVPSSDDFDGMRKEWSEFYAFGGPGYSRAVTQQPDTIIVRGVPSRWFAEPRVSSKPSMLVTHTIFSTFGKIRNLSVAEDDDLGKNDDEDNADIVSGLQCKIVVQFEKYGDFYNVIKVLSGRSLQKQGSRLKADYEVTWDRDGFFRDARNHAHEKNARMLASGRYECATPGQESNVSQFSSAPFRTKRFKE